MRASSIVLILITLISTGCEKVIPYEEQTYTPRLVVNGMIEAGSAISIRVTESTSILSEHGNNFEEINNCQARLYENGVLVESLSSGTEGEYAFSYIAQATMTYRVELDHDRLPDVSCETLVPGAVNILQAVGESTSDFETAVNLRWNDSDNANYYQLLMYQVYNQNTDTNLVGWYTSSPYFTLDALGDGESYFWDSAMFLDELFKNASADLDINVDYYFNPDQSEDVELVAVLLGCSEGYYRYRSSLRLYNESDGGLFSQPVQIYSNVEGGLGVLAASSKSVLAVEF